MDEVIFMDDMQQSLLIKYPWLSERDACSILMRAKADMLDIIYKSDRSIRIENYDFSCARDTCWLLDRCDEIVERTGCSSMTSYKENGLNFTFDNARISYALISRLSTVCGVIK